MPEFLDRRWRTAKQSIDDWIEQNGATILQAYDDHANSFDLVNRQEWDDDFDGEFPSYEEIIGGIEEIVPHINLRIANGQTGLLLNYERGYISGNQDQMYAPDDIFTIAIGGFKMGRGLTLEGLCTTLFLIGRSADDTTIQRQRWFGYRGVTLNTAGSLCRIMHGKIEKISNLKVLMSVILTMRG